MRHIILGGLFSGLFLTACSTTPDPAEVCTAEWITPRAERAVDRIADRTKPALKSLRKAGDSWARGKDPSIFKMMSLQRSVRRLADELEDGKGMQHLKTLANTCDDPNIISTAMSDFLREQGLSDQIIGFIESLGFYEQALEKAKDSTT